MMPNPTDSPQAAGEPDRNQFGLRKLLLWIVFSAVFFALWRWLGGWDGYGLTLLPAFFVVVTSFDFLYQGL